MDGFESRGKILFPLNGRRRFAGYVVNDTIDALYFINDTVGHFSK